jgi:hypothetical protein
LEEGLAREFLRLDEEGGLSTLLEVFDVFEQLESLASSVCF